MRNFRKQSNTWTIPAPLSVVFYLEVCPQLRPDFYGTYLCCIFVLIQSLFRLSLEPLADYNGNSGYHCSARPISDYTRLLITATHHKHTDYMGNYTDYGNEVACDAVDFTCDAARLCAGEYL